MEYDSEAIVPAYITDYLRMCAAHNDDFLHSLEQYAAENNVPIALPETAAFLAAICEMKRPHSILEVGCAIGYSAILMAKHTDNECKIMTLDYDKDIIAKARKNISDAGFSDRINVIYADAADYLPYLEDDESFDLIFLDGPKTQYVYMLDDCVRLLKKGGVLIADNVLYKGMTADENHVVRRKITIVSHLRSFIADVMKHKQLSSALLPLGDGVTMSVKIKAESEV